MGDYSVHPIQAIEQSAPCPSGTPQSHWLHSVTRDTLANNRTLLIDLDRFKKDFTVTIVGSRAAHGITPTTTDIGVCSMAAERKAWNARSGASTPPKLDVQHVRFNLGESARAASGKLSEEEGLRKTQAIVRDWWPDRSPGQMLTFIGHTDNVGFAPSAAGSRANDPRANERTSAGCNMRLSLARAYHVAETFLSNNNDVRGQKNVHLVACGTAIATPTAGGHADDRRVDIMVVGDRRFAHPPLPRAQ